MADGNGCLDPQCVIQSPVTLNTQPSSGTISDKWCIVPCVCVYVCKYIYHPYKLGATCCYFLLCLTSSAIPIIIFTKFHVCTSRTLVPVTL